MKEMKSMDEFWKAYNSLQWIFMELKKQGIVDHLEETRNAVNGLGDGWQRFKIGFYNIEKMWPSQLKGEAEQIFKKLKEVVDNWAI